MRLTHDLLLHQGLRGLRIRSQIVQLLLCHVLVDNQFELLLYSILHRVFEFSLNRLTHPKHVAKLLRERSMHRLFDSSLGLKLILLIVCFDLVLHHIEERLDRLEMLFVTFND